LSTESSDFEAFARKYHMMVLDEIGLPVRPDGAKGSSSTLLMQLEHDNTMEEILAELKGLDIVDLAEPNYILFHDEETGLEFIPDDDFYGNQWGLKNTGNAVSYYGNQVGTPGSDINVEPAWDITKGSSGITVAVIDDGIDPNHLEFLGRIAGGYDFINDDTDPTCAVSDYHGTACAGIVAAANDGNGVVGVAPGVKIMPLRVCDEEGCSTADIIAAIYYAVDNGARVISMSIGGGSYSSFTNEAINYAVNNNVVVLASAGNNNENNAVNSHYPSGYANCISVGAMSPCDERKTPSTCDGETWWGSNYGDLDFIAPGTRIYSTDGTGSNGYSSGDYMSMFNGTSAACPHAAGVAALILSADPTLTALKVRQTMQLSAYDLGNTGYDAETGYGRLDAYGALQLIQSGGDYIIITNQGTGDLNLTDISVDKSWLLTSSVSTPLVISAGESVVVDVSVNWDLVTSTRTGTITIQSDDSDEGSVDVTVTANPVTVETYSITAVPLPENGGFISGSGEASFDQTVTVVATAAAQYKFMNWTEDGVEVSTDLSYTFVVNGDRDLVANFEMKEYTVSASANPSEGGSVSGTGSYEYGTIATLTATPSSGYAFLNWTVNSEVVSSSAAYVFTVTGNRTLVANFAMDYYTVTATADPGEGGSVNGGGDFMLNQMVELHALPAPGYDFVEWTEGGDRVSTSEDYLFTVTRNRTLVARFEPGSIQITGVPFPALGGTIDGQGTYTYGQVVSLTANPSEGYSFVNWTANDVEVSNEPVYTFTAYENRNLVANFATSTMYTVTAVSVPAEGGTITGADTYQYGTLVTLTAVPNGGYVFMQWMDGDRLISVYETLMITLTDDRQLEAHFVYVGTGFDDPDRGEEGFSLYPNPVHDELLVRIHAGLEQGAVISLYDVNSKMISNYRVGAYLPGDELRFDMSGLAPGIYFIRITGSDQVHTGKFIKR